jgi:hypothetical protein
MRHLVNAHDDGQKQSVVLPCLDLDAVGVAHPEPPTRDFGDLISATLDLVLMVDDIALGLHVLAAVNIDENRSRAGVRRAFFTVAT